MAAALTVRYNYQHIKHWRLNFTCLVVAYANDSCDKTCPKGHAVCINSLGVPDLSNKDKCYVTKDMATTHTCNSATGKVQLEARISKETVSKNNPDLALERCVAF